MATVNLPSRVLGRKKTENWRNCFVKLYFWASWGKLLPPLPLPGYAYAKIHKSTFILTALFVFAYFSYTFDSFGPVIKR